MTNPALALKICAPHIHTCRIRLMTKCAIQFLSVRQVRNCLSREMQRMAEFECVWVAGFFRMYSEFRMIPGKMMNHSCEPLYWPGTGKDIFASNTSALECLLSQMLSFVRRCCHGGCVPMAERAISFCLQNHSPAA